MAVGEKDRAPIGRGINEEASASVLALMSSFTRGRTLAINQAGGQAGAGQQADLCATPTKPIRLLKVTFADLFSPVNH